MLNSDHNHKQKLQLKLYKDKTTTLLKQFVLKEFVNLFCDTELQAMLLESQMEVMEQTALRWVSVIVGDNHLGKQLKDEIQANYEQWIIFRDLTGVTEVEIFTNPFTDPKTCISRVDLKSLGGWDDSPVKFGIRPALVW